KKEFFPLNTEVKQRLPNSQLILTKSDGKLLVMQKFKTSALCNAFKNDVTVSFFDRGNNRSISSDKICNPTNKALEVFTTTVPPGEYKVSLVYDFEQKAMVALPKIVVHYQTPEFQSEDDHILEGA